MNIQIIPDWEASGMPTAGAAERASFYRPPEKKRYNGPMVKVICEKCPIPIQYFGDAEGYKHVDRKAAPVESDHAVVARLFEAKKAS